MNKFIGDIWITQHNLERIDQIPAMIEDIGFLPPVLLNQLPDGSIEAVNGHHRLHAYWLAGKRYLKPLEYILVQKESSNKTRFYQLKNSPWLSS